MADLKQLAEQIVNLTLLQAQELKTILKDEYGIEPAAGGAVMMAGPAGGAAAPAERMGDLLKGMTVLAYSQDPVAAAKAVEAFVKDNKKLVVLGGAMGATPLDEAGVKAVAQMPSREELIASVVACIGAPASDLASAIGAPAANIAGILTTLEEREAA